ncbi:MAG: hypothetical protein KDE55_21355 [Novosphingobium sp.]|nr:hypothetical protein [Novosphingobium sp.]
MARLFLSAGQTFGTVGGFDTTDVIGTNDFETVYNTADALATYDPSFNRGGDTINIAGEAEIYSASLSGSAIVLTADNGARIQIPVGEVGATIVFADASRTLVFDGTNVLLGDQIITGTPVDVTPGQVGTLTNFNIEAGLAAGADVMHITGDVTARVDLTKNSNQVTGVDLNGDGVIALNGQENNPAYFNDILGIAAEQTGDYEIVDAYIRDRLNYYNEEENFLGNLLYDGTGVGGDGVNTNGNIVLGGLGADVIFGGIGNDFLVGGGVLPALPSSSGDPLLDSLNRLLDFLTRFSNAFDFYNAYSTYNTGGIDAISGGRNADFFFADFSTLSLADGDALFIDAGTTADDTSAATGFELDFDYEYYDANLGDTEFSAQDSDWFLPEIADDEEPIVIQVREGAAGLIYSEDQVSTIFANIFDIENVDASGNLYGFVDDLDVALGENGMVVNGENVGIGSSAQLVIEGSYANNILIGGYDNDRIFGADGRDLLMGGNLKYALNNPNAAGIINDGMDQLYGGDGNDDIVFEADGGRIWGGDDNDTLWLTDQSLGTQDASDVTVDGWLRFDLLAGGVENEPTELNAGQTFESAGYGGADVSGTQDQTNYAGGGYRVDVESIENVDATGLGRVDYRAAGSNDPELLFNNQQNHGEYLGNLDLRGTAGDNDLFASDGGTDNIEGRAGNDVLGGGALDDDFYFSIDGDTIYDDHPVYGEDQDDMETPDPICDLEEYDGYGEGGEDLCNPKGTGDGVDVIVGKADEDDDNLWDTVGSATYLAGAATAFIPYGTEHQNLPTILGTRYWDVDGDGTYDFMARNVTQNGDISDAVLWKQDFGDAAQETNASFLTIDFRTTNFSDPEVIITNFSIKIGGETFAVNSADLADVQNAAEIAAIVNARFNAQDSSVTVTSQGNAVIVEDAEGRNMSDTIGEGYLISFALSNSAAETFAEFTDQAPTIFQDRLIYKSYEDRSDNEGVDDDAITGSLISLGVDGYAEDLVVDFAADGTRLAEDQFYNVYFGNLTTEDMVTMTINGVDYCLQVGVALNGTQVDDEDGQLDSQVSIQTAFLERFAAYINSFMDDDTAAGSICAEVLYGVNSVSLTINELLNSEGNAIYDFDNDGDIDVNDKNQINSAISSGTLSAVGIQISQHAYAGEETVFIDQPSVEITNDSGGEIPYWSVENVSEHEVFLFGYDGRNGGLNEENVVFVGEEDISRANLLTAADAGSTLVGKDAMVIDAHSDDLVNDDGSDIPVNKAIDTELTSKDETDNVTFHGDDLLITGKGNDTVMGGTGDDRVRGSIGNDVLDGGDDDYAVLYVGESNYEHQILSAYEASLRDAEADVVDVAVIRQSENGLNTIGGTSLTPVPGYAAYYSDTLIYQQSDLDEQLGNAAGTANVKITLDHYIGTGEGIIFNEGGAGTVVVDYDGDHSYADETNKQTFTAFEHVRTVAGIGKAVAGDGQGNDTLDISKLSTDADVGVYYDLTDAGMAGTVALIEDLDNNAKTDPTLREVLRVDGVEHVIFGDGDDLLKVDETEAAKNNDFTGGLGTDRVEYYVEFAEDMSSADFSLEPQVRFELNTAADTDRVTMTDGRLGEVVATDTLVSFEEYGFYGLTARGPGMNDVLDASRLSSGALIDYTQGATAADVPGRIYDGSVLVATVDIEGLVQFETVLGSAANDKIIVADSEVMCCNINMDNDASGLEFDTYLNYDYLNADCERESVADLRSTGQDSSVPGVTNFAVFTFNLAGGTKDRVDYHETDDSIAAVVKVVDGSNYVFVDGDGGSLDPDSKDSGFSDSPFGDYDECDRVDELIGVEEIVAANNDNTSLLDFTSLTDEDGNPLNTIITVGAADSGPVGLRESAILIENADTNNVIAGLPRYIELYDTKDSATEVFGTTWGPIATWNRFEGGDTDEAIIYEAADDVANNPGLDHRFTDDVQNLRGGNNEVNYSALATSINTVFTYTASDGVDAFNTGVIHAVTNFTDGAGLPLANAGTHNTYSNAIDNKIVGGAGTLRLEASQDAEDVLIFNGSDEKQIILTDDLVRVLVGDETKEETATMTGYETVIDSGNSDDCYVVPNLSIFSLVFGFTLADNVNDHDALAIGNDAASTVFNGGNPDGTTVSLDALNTYIGSADMDVLDIRNVTLSTLVRVIGDNDALDTDMDLTDELVIGSFGNIDFVDDFESLVVTDSTIANGGAQFTIDTDTNTITQVGNGANFVTNNDLNVLSANGLVFEDSLVDNTCAPGVTANVVFQATGTEAVEFYGGTGDDALRGAGGEDLLYGGLGADNLNGGFTAAKGERVVFVLDANTTFETADTLTIDAGTGGTLIIGGPTAGGADFNLAGAVSDEDAVGTFLASLTAAQWNTELDLDGVTVGEPLITSVTYNAATNTLVIDFAPTMDYDTTGASLTLVSGSATPLNATIYTEGSGGVTDPSNTYMPVANESDTFLYMAAAESNQASMDTIVNFDVVANTGVNDVIDLSGIDAITGTPIDDAFVGFNAVASGTYSSLSQIIAAFDNPAGYAGFDVRAADDGTDTYVFVDADQSNNYTAGDMIIKIAGLDDATLLSGGVGGNFMF